MLKRKQSVVHEKEMREWTWKFWFSFCLLSTHFSLDLEVTSSSLSRTLPCDSQTPRFHLVFTLSRSKAWSEKQNWMFPYAAMYVTSLHSKDNFKRHIRYAHLYFIGKINFGIMRHTSKCLVMSLPLNTKRTSY